MGQRKSKCPPQRLTSFCILSLIYIFLDEVVRDEEVISVK
jgi:hypothetical protein